MESLLLASVPPDSLSLYKGWSAARPN